MPEQKLFIAVLVQGFTDALNKFLWLSRSNKRFHREAKDWIGSNDFDQVCSYAGWQPNQAKEIYTDISRHKHYLTTEDIRYLLNETFSRRSVL
jgi:hypothetical protein|tara:strand:+ start:5085 stop:5363 length:279 start_codon:yes stop_codon:yes gene_type:complete